MYFFLLRIFKTEKGIIATAIQIQIAVAFCLERISSLFLELTETEMKSMKVKKKLMQIYKNKRLLHKERKEKRGRVLLKEITGSLSMRAKEK